MLERRYSEIIESLVSRDRAWLNSLHSFCENLRLMYQEQVNMGATLESIGKRQREFTKANEQILDWAMTTLSEFTKANEQILDWAMTTLSGKKKVSLPKINISNYVHYIIVPPNVQDFVIPYS